MLLLLWAYDQHPFSASCHTLFQCYCAFFLSSLPRHHSKLSMTFIFWESPTSTFFPISACKLLYLLYKPRILTCCVAARMGTRDVVWPETCSSPVVHFIKDSQYFGLFIYYNTSQHIVSVYLFRWQDTHNNLLFCFLSAPTVICIFSRSLGIFETRLIVLRIFWAGK